MARSLTQFRTAQAVSRRGLASRREIAAAVGIAENTVSTQVGLLRDASILAPEDRRIGGVGYVSLNPEAGALVGVDIQRRRLQVEVTDLGLGALTPKPLSETIDIDGDAKSTLRAAAKLIARQIELAGVPPSQVVGIGLALPGPIDRASGRPVSRYIMPGWEEVRPATELEQLLESEHDLELQAVVHNEASLGALGLYTDARFRDPAGADEDLIYIRAALGIGAGVVLNGELVEGADGYAGELGHVKVDPSGPLCPRCGGRGCVESVAGLKAVIDQARASGALNTDDPDELLATDHPACQQALWEAGWHVGVALAHACNLLNPRRILIGGEMSQSDLFLDAVRHAIERNALPQVWKDASGARCEADRVPAGRLSPELSGALALVLRDCGDQFLTARIEQHDFPGVP